MKHRRSKRTLSTEDIEELMASLGKDDGPDFDDDGKDIAVVGNRVFFYQDVNSSSAANLATTLRAVAMDLQIEQVHLDLPSCRPIHLHINSQGGDLFAGFALVDTLRGLKVPVHTHVEGGAASAATLFSVVGKHRTIGKHSFILIHQLAAVLVGKHEHLKDEMENNISFTQVMLDLYAEHTKMTAEDLNELLKHDIWFNAEKALETGLVDEII